VIGSAHTTLRPTLVQTGRLNNEVPVHPNEIEPKQGEMKGYVVHEPAAKYTPEGMVEQQDHRDGS
jgi:hypothetical protein